MILRIPAIVIGIFAIFCIGYVVTHSIIDKIVKKKKGTPLLYRDNLREVKFKDDWTEEDIENISRNGGIFTVILVVIFMIVAPAEWRKIIWTILTVIGFLLGILTFLRR